MSSADTPMMQQYRALKRQYPDCILFFRMGDFYEMFGDDAVEAARVLAIQVTTRDKGSKNPVPMCGIPYHALDGYLPRLIKEGYKVAIAEQTEDPKKAKGLVKRDVTKVVTPGTVTDEGMLDDRAHNYLAAVAPDRHGYGLAAADLSTGLLKTCQFPGEEGLAGLLDELERLDPKQVLVPDGFEEAHPALAKELLVRHPRGIDRLEPWAFGVTHARELLTGQFKVSSLSGFGLEEADLAVAAAGAAVGYLRDTQKSELSQIGRITLVNPADHMLLDPATMRNLELVRSLMDGTKKGSLLALVDRSVTPMGGRQIREWLLRPLCDLPRIAERHETVAAFFDRPEVIDAAREALNGVGDMERMAARISTSQCPPRDLLNIGAALARLPLLREATAGIDTQVSRRWSSVWDDCGDIAALLADAIADDPPAMAREGGAIREGYHAELDELRSIKRDSRTAILDLESAARRLTGIATLKVKYNKIYGYFMEVSRKQADAVPMEWQRKQSLVNAERFISPELKELEEKIVTAEERATTLELRLYEQVRSQVAAELSRIQFMAAVVGAVDAFRGLAELAREKRYVRPQLDASGVIDIEGGRHPIIEEAGLSERFVPNDTRLDTETARLAVITGPNMAGKSTYIRQVALITLLAQVGSFVPARRARIGLCDRIFTRVGAQDHLQKGESTFMVEMNETANILNNATARSLVILDEIGRGTSTFDGLSIAWSVAEYLHQRGARTLFATHYHELTELAVTLPAVKNLSVAVKEWNDEIVFLRTIVEEGADRSYGIQVARLAGLPREVIERAKEILAFHEANELDVSGQPKLKARTAERDRVGDYQISLFAPTVAPSEVEEALRALDLNGVTPLAALNLLAELKRKSER